jgi:hypothetical protein
MAGTTGDSGGILGLLGLGGGSSPNLTPDQQAMQSQLGYYYNPDAVLPTGTPNTQPAGYSNLTPAQSATVNALGYYTQPGAQQGQGQSIWDRASKILNDPNFQQGMKSLGNIGQPSRSSQPIPGAYNNPGFAHFPGYGPYTIYRRSSLNPKQALANITAGQ